MQIVTNAGSNLQPEIVAHYGIHLTPQHIVAGGKEFDTRQHIPYEVIDGWVRDYKEFPHVVGTTAPEFVTQLQTLAKEDPEILVITTSRRIIHTHAAALSAAKTLAAHPAYAHVRITVIDSTVTDAAAGLLCIAAGEAKRAGLGMAQTARMLEQMADSARFCWVLGTLEYLVKGGRASWLKARFADMLGLRPIVGLVGGEVVKVGTVSSREDRVIALTQHLVASVGAGRKVWLACIHTGAAFEESGVAAEMRRMFDVAYVYSCSLSSSIYVHTGPGAIGAAVIPIDDLAWTPPVPPAFSLGPVGASRRPPRV